MKNHVFVFQLKNYQIYMEKFEFERKSDVKDFYEMEINYDIAKYNHKFVENRTDDFETILNQLHSLGFLNILYQDFAYFVNNMNEYDKITNYFCRLYSKNIPYIETLLMLYNIDLSPIGEMALDSLNKYIDDNAILVYSSEYQINKFQSFTNKYLQLLKTNDCTEKLSEFVNLESNLKNTYFRKVLKESQNQLINKLNNEIDRLKSLHLLNLLPQDKKNNSTKNEELEIQNEQISILNKQLDETKTFLNYIPENTVNEKQNFVDIHPNTLVLDMNTGPSQIGWLTNEPSTLKQASHYKTFNIQGIDPLLELSSIIEHNKPKASLKKFPDFILHENKNGLSKSLKSEFSTEKSKSIRYLLEALALLHPPLITVIDGEKKALYNSMKEYFNRDIGSYNSIFQCNFNPESDPVEKQNLGKFKVRIKHILDKL